MNSATRKKIISYSLLAVSYNYLYEQSEIVHVDFDPDIILDIDADTTLDLDFDGYDDFIFSNDSSTRHYTSYGTFYWTRYRQRMFVSPEQAGNEVIGSTFYIDSSSGGFYRYYPAALDFGSPVISDQNWINSGFLVRRIMFVADSTGFDQGGNWYPIQIDKYIGFRFQHDNQRHYGWLRCDVLNEGKLLVLKDYAYEETADKGLFAGSQSPIDQPDETFAASVYTYNDVIHISFNFQIANPVNLTLCDIDGRSIYTQILTATHTTLSLKLPAGVYALHFFSKDLNETKTIVMHR